MRTERLLVLALGIATLCGCAMHPVQPWERGRLARWDMQWDPDPLQKAQDEHECKRA